VLAMTTIEAFGIIKGGWALCVDEDGGLQSRNKTHNAPPLILAIFTDYAFAITHNL